MSDDFDPFAIRLGKRKLNVLPEHYDRALDELGTFLHDLVRRDFDYDKKVEDDVFTHHIGDIDGRELVLTGDRDGCVSIEFGGACTFSVGDNYDGDRPSELMELARVFAKYYAAAKIRDDASAPIADEHFTARMVCERIAQDGYRFTEVARNHLGVVAIYAQGDLLGRDLIHWYMTVAYKGKPKRTYTFRGSVGSVPEKMVRQLSRNRVFKAQREDGQ